MQPAVVHEADDEGDQQEDAGDDAVLQGQGKDEQEENGDGEASRCRPGSTPSASGLSSTPELRSSSTPTMSLTRPIDELGDQDGGARDHDLPAGTTHQRDQSSDDHGEDQCLARMDRP